MSCQFCHLAQGQGVVYIVYQTDLISCFLDTDPISEGHTLIVPKKHALDTEELDRATRLDIMDSVVLLSKAIKQLYHPDGISIMQNGGYFNDVNHYHMHVFARYKHDGFAWLDSNQPVQTALAQTASNLISIIKR